MSVGEKFLSDGHAFDAYNHTDHAARLVEEAQQALRSDRLDDAMRWLDEAEQANERAQYAIQDAKRRLRAVSP